MIIMKEKYLRIDSCVYSTFTMYRMWKTEKLIVPENYKCIGKDHINKFIDYMILRHPFPQVFLKEDTKGHLFSIIGGEYLLSIFDFFENKYSVDISLYDKSIFFKEMDSLHQNRLEDCKINVYEIMIPYSDEDIERIIKFYGRSGE